MAELKSSRPFQERFLDGFDRSQLSEEVRRVKRRRFSGLKKKYTSWALGATLALGGMAVPMEMAHQARPKAISGDRADNGLTHPDSDLAGDLRTAGKIAAEVAGGVQSAGQSPLQTVSQAPQQIASAVVALPQAALTTAESATEEVKAHFFATKIPFGSIIYREARKNDLPPELVAAVVDTESKSVPTARSSRGAIGLMQLEPQTGRWMGARDLTNPADNIAAGAKYLKYLSGRFDGDPEKTIAAFNAGEGNVRRFDGVPPFRETRAFVQRVQLFQSDLNGQVSNHVAEIAQLAEVR